MINIIKSSINFPSEVADANTMQQIVNRRELFVLCEEKKLLKRLYNKTAAEIALGC